jgi:hypothetical protein
MDWVIGLFDVEGLLGGLARENIVLDELSV